MNFSTLQKACLVGTQATIIKAVYVPPCGTSQLNYLTNICAKINNRAERYNISV